MFFALAGAMVELKRQETMEAINVRVIAGQRGVDDDDFDRILKDLSQSRVSNEPELSPEEYGKLRGQVAKLNTLWAEANG